MDADSSLIDYSLKEMKDIRKKNAKKSLKSVYEVGILLSSDKSTTMPLLFTFFVANPFSLSMLEVCNNSRTLMARTPLEP